jgi:integrase
MDLDGNIQGHRQSSSNEEHILHCFGMNPSLIENLQSRSAQGCLQRRNTLLKSCQCGWGNAKWEIAGIKTNPCKGVPLMEENNKKERYLSVEEAQRLYEVVCQSENTMLRYIVPMLILTGARKREVLDAKWQDFDCSRRIWRIPMSKSGKARHVPLSDGALALLATMPRKSDCEWAFANPETEKPYVSIFCAWNTARKSVGLSDVRMHDLRHSFASLLINSGRTLYEVQHILGHTQVKTTQRYAHLSQDTLLAAANSATTALGAAMMPATASLSLVV